MAAGRAVVASAVGGTPQLIEHGQNGLLVPPGDVEPLSAAILKLMDQPAFAARLATAARQRVCERYGMDLRAQRFESFYARLLGRPQFSRDEDVALPCTWD